MSTIKGLVPSSRNFEDDDGDGHINNCNGEIKANTLQISTEYYMNTEWGPTTQDLQESVTVSCIVHLLFES